MTPLEYMRLGAELKTVLTHPDCEVDFLTKRISLISSEDPLCPKVFGRVLGIADDPANTLVYKGVLDWYLQVCRDGLAEEHRLGFDTEPLDDFQTLSDMVKEFTSLLDEFASSVNGTSLAIASGFNDFRQDSVELRLTAIAVVCYIFSVHDLQDCDIACLESLVEVD